MRRLLLSSIALVLLLAATAGPAGAQEELGVTIDPTEGPVGSTVGVQVDVDDINAHCLDPNDPAGAAQELADAISAFVTLIQLENGGPLLPEPLGSQVVLLQGLALGLTLPIPDQAALDANQEQFLAGMFVLTFADPATQDRIGETSNYDRHTGQGTIEVPDLDPGIWGLAAACTGPVEALEENMAAFEAALAATQPILDVFGGTPITILDLLNNTNDVQTLLADLAPTIIEQLVTPRAFGFQPFCILDAAGNCGESPAEAPVPPAPGPAATGPVTASPAFTG